MRLAWILRGTTSREDFAESVDELRHMERAGLGMALVQEFYGFDAVSRLGYLAARTSTLQLGPGILPLYSRSPGLTAMTAAGLDFVSGGRFVLGLGTSGPMVVEGFHGVAFDAPVGRTREVVDICRRVWRREKLQYSGSHYQVPLGGGDGRTFADAPIRSPIRVMLAAIGQRNVELAAEIAEIWMPIHYDAGRANRAFASALAAGSTLRDPNLGPLEVLTEGPCLRGG